MRLLTKEEIIFLNKNNISKYGGNFVPPQNLLHENPLDYLVEIVDGNLFGEPIYPEVYHKAGVYLFNIISNHIFTDGNKRTGLDACILFLDFNGYQFSETVSNEILTDFILSIASGKQSLEEVQNWLKNNSINK
jgi:death-on-curing protein